MVEMLGEAKAQGWRITARCAWGKRDAMKSILECVSRYDLDLDTLIWTRGPPSRFRCSPSGSNVRAAGRVAWRCCSIFQVSRW
jgi:hypothetical protein